MESAELAEKHVGLAHYFARRAYENHRIPFDQALSDAYLGLVRATRRANPDLPFVPYACKFIQGAILQGVRDSRGWRRTTVEKPVFCEIPEDLRDPAPQQAAEARDLWEAVDSLPERQATSIRLNYMYGIPQEDIGEALGVTQTQVSRYITAGRGALRKLLAA